MKTRRSLIPAALPPILVAALLLAPSPARAEVGANIDADIDIDAPLGYSGSIAIGVGGRFG